jgi:hypothetical protein
MNSIAKMQVSPVLRTKQTLKKKQNMKKNTPNSSKKTIGRRKMIRNCGTNSRESITIGQSRSCDGFTTPSPRRCKFTEMPALPRNHRTLSIDLEQYSARRTLEF